MGGFFALKDAFCTNPNYFMAVYCASVLFEGAIFYFSDCKELALVPEKLVCLCGVRVRANDLFK